MNTCKVIVEAYATTCVARGLASLETIGGYEGLCFLRPDILRCTLGNLDFGRYDSEGVDYISDLLACAPSEIISTSLKF